MPGNILSYLQAASQGMYYYQCGTNIKSTEIHCTKSDTGFKDFHNPSDYTNVMRLSLRKEAAEKKIMSGSEAAMIGASAVSGVVGLFSVANAYAGAETGESRILTDELRTSSYIIINK
jgi:predicted lipoprotein